MLVVQSLTLGGSLTSGTCAFLVLALIAVLLHANRQYCKGRYRAKVTSVSRVTPIPSQLSRAEPSLDDQDPVLAVAKGKGMHKDKSVASSCHGQDLPDVTIKAGGQEFHCHKSVLRQSSKYLEDLVDKQGRRRKNHKHIILDLNSKCPDAVEAILHYIHTGKYDLRHHDYSRHLAVSAKAEKYQRPELEALAFDAFLLSTGTVHDTRKIFLLTETLRSDHRRRHAKMLERQHLPALLNSPEYCIMRGLDRSKTWRLLCEMNSAVPGT